MFLVQYLFVKATLLD